MGAWKQTWSLAVVTPLRKITEVEQADSSGHTTGCGGPLNSRADREGEVESETKYSGVQPVRRR